MAGLAGRDLLPFVFPWALLPNLLNFFKPPFWWLVLAFVTPLNYISIHSQFPRNKFDKFLIWLTCPAFQLSRRPAGRSRFFEPIGSPCRRIVN